MPFDQGVIWAMFRFIFGRWHVLCLFADPRFRARFHPFDICAVAPKDQQRQEDAQQQG